MKYNAMSVSFCDKRGTLCFGLLSQRFQSTVDLRQVRMGNRLASGTPLDLGCTHTPLLQSTWQAEPLT